jgi:Rieske Fe-S protein
VSAAVSRRSALTAAAVVVAGGVIGFVYGRNSDAAKSPSRSAGQPYGGAASGTRKPLADLATVPSGGGLITSGVVLTREAGGVHAFSSTCTHLGCTVNRVADGKIFCPCHGSVFNARTGAVEQGPATQPLPPVAITVESGVIYAG